MKDLMIDLETLGTDTEEAPVISIGAAWFDIDTKTIGPTYYRVLNVTDQIDTKTRFVDTSTLKFWMNQQNAAKSIFRDEALPTKQVLIEFRQWIMNTAKAGPKSKATKKCNPWGNGAGFDINLMESMFKSYNVDCPWLFYNVMDLRTFKRFQGQSKKVEKLEGVNHNALDDAINQINYIFSCTE